MFFPHVIFMNWLLYFEDRLPVNNNTNNIVDVFAVQSALYVKHRHWKSAFDIQ